ncbi:MULTISPECIES: transglycosylase SLT domain-containing protein [unclassified Solwaraspora]|uniref:aggregation-promoting factor C-terminal-like domain-containing protein n=1 Tax=unclassified Solwaraspora TaxID=2627926 RepID=UPI00259BCFDB|nr:transglycosylase SLT domain-containing protein [Solwaraspora sp. WMMA2056]WJK40579.1 transglycosylase SLT domain-containing protein [Solwaraspora sp. WMMA2056]
MSRLWSRFGLRALAVGLLVTGVAGGFYLESDRDTQQRISDARLAAQAEQVELELLRQRRAEHQRVTVQRRTAEREAAEKATAAAKSEAAKVKRAEQVTQQKQEQTAQQPSNSGATVPFTGEIPASCDEFSGNRAIGCALTLERGWGLDQFACLNKLWNKESGWNHKAYNAASGATGIPQAVPGNKMSSAGADWQTNPATQIKWGLGYIANRYTNPCGAWQMSQAEGWY